METKMGSFLKKVKTISKHGLESYEEGKRNFNIPIPRIEEVAENRAKICNTCELKVLEPLREFRVTDIRIPELSEMMCADCGCTSSYLVRQNLKICTKWQS